MLCWFNEIISFGETVRVKAVTTYFSRLVNVLFS